MRYAFAGRPLDRRARCPMPPNVVGRRGRPASDESETFFASVTSFLTPSTPVAGRRRRPAEQVVKSLPARFDAATHVTEQFEATSKDGTKIPYFVVRPKDMKLRRLQPDAALRLRRLPGVDDARPIRRRSASCGWSAAASMCWPTSAAAASSGPRWHQAGLKQNRQRVYDDFAAVAEDLIARKITSPRAARHHGRLQRRPADGRGS